MSKSTLRIAVIALTLVTAAVHLYLGVTSISGPMQTLGILWLLNGLGYLVLLGGITGQTPVLKDNKALAHYGLMGFAAVTIVAWVVMSGVLRGDAPDLLAIITKVDEVLLIVVAYMHLK